jgi:hypothetical protein
MEANGLRGGQITRGDFSPMPPVGYEPAPSVCPGRLRECSGGRADRLEEDNLEKKSHRALNVGCWRRLGMPRQGDVG